MNLYPLYIFGYNIFLYIISKYKFKFYKIHRIFSINNNNTVLKLCKLFFVLIYYNTTMF